MMPAEARERLENVAKLKVTVIVAAWTAADRMCRVRWQIMLTDENKASVTKSEAEFLKAPAIRKTPPVLVRHYKTLYVLFVIRHRKCKHKLSKAVSRVLRRTYKHLWSVPACGSTNIVIKL